jgi:TrmH family RNA methyltransferase
VIGSVRNRRIVEAVRLRRGRDRDDAGAFLVDGPQATLEAIRSEGPVREVFHVPAEGGGPAVGQVLGEARARGLRLTEVSEPVLARLSSSVTPQGVVAVAAFVDRPLDAIGTRAGPVVVLVGVADPGNAGTIVRTAHAAGAGAVVLTAGSVDVYNPKAVRATAGSLFHIPIVRGADPMGTIRHLRTTGRSVVAAAADGDTPIDGADLAGPLGVLFGSEAHGLPPELLAAADVTVRVPLLGRAESLNLAAAAAVILFEAARQRHARRGDA